MQTCLQRTFQGDGLTIGLIDSMGLLILAAGCASRTVTGITEKSVEAERVVEPPARLPLALPRMGRHTGKRRRTQSTFCLSGAAMKSVPSNKGRWSHPPNPRRAQTRRSAGATAASEEAKRTLLQINTRLYSEAGHRRHKAGGLSTFCRRKRCHDDISCGEHSSYRDSGSAG